MTADAKTNEELAAWLDKLTLSTRDAQMLRAAAAALRGLDAQPDADNSTFHVAFDTASAPGKIVVTTVRLGVQVVGEQLAKVKKFNVALCNHPSYQNLRQYVLANPEACPDLPKTLTLSRPE